MTKAEIDAMATNELRRDMAGTMAALNAERAKVKQLEAEKAELMKIVRHAVSVNNELNSIMVEFIYRKR